MAKYVTKYYILHLIRNYVTFLYNKLYHYLLHICTYILYFILFSFFFKILNDLKLLLAFLIIHFQHDICIKMEKQGQNSFTLEKTII